MVELPGNMLSHFAIVFKYVGQTDRHPHTHTRRERDMIWIVSVSLFVRLSLSMFAMLACGRAVNIMLPHKDVTDSTNYNQNKKIHMAEPRRGANSRDAEAVEEAVNG